MTHTSWREAVADIRAVTDCVTDRQQAVALAVGLEFPSDLPRLVANARLKIALDGEVGLEGPIPSTYFQMETIAELETKADKARPRPTDRREADAWIDFLRLRNRQRVLERLKLETGDIVEITKAGQSRFAEISSIGSDGRVFLKGGPGGRAWPDMIAIHVRKSDNSAHARTLRRQFANEAAHVARVASWSMVKQSELEQFSVNSRLTKDDVDQLEEVISSADNERPIQLFIEARPQLLAGLLGGSHGRFVVPRRSLAGKYIPDFFMSDLDSLGIRWVLVELETPNSTVTLRHQNDLDASARKGVSQIREWREWLQNNLDIARRAKKLDGLGLIDIRPRSEGLVLVGRRSLLQENTSAVRNAVREESNISVHTYDWLLEHLRGALEFVGPSGLNPYLLPPQREG